jgi:dihydropteroate synthase
MMSRYPRFNGLALPSQPVHLMGIVNLTPDSFSDGGKFNSLEQALVRIRQLVRDGATIIDLGAESTRPGAEPVSASEELDRLLPILNELPKDEFLISVDSCKLEVQKAAAESGAHILNDIYGGSDELYALAEKHQCGLVLMHTPAPPQTMQEHTDYGGRSIVDVVLDFFAGKEEELRKYNVPGYWLDPGIGFGKTPAQCIQLLKNIRKFTANGYGVLIGASRKSWIGKTLGGTVDQRMGASISSALHAAREGAEIVRVHDVFETAQALKTEQLLKAPGDGDNQLILENIETRTHIGIHAEEKITEQGIRISINMKGDFSKVIQEDDLTMGVDYVDIIQEVRKFCAAHRGNTLEHLADVLARHLKLTFRADAIELTLDKPRYTGKLELSAIRFHVRR